MQAGEPGDKKAGKKTERTYGRTGGYPNNDIRFIKKCCSYLKLKEEHKKDLRKERCGLGDY